MKEIGGSLPGHKTWVAAPPFFPSLILLNLTLLPALVDVEASKKPLETKYKIRTHAMPPKAGSTSKTKSAEQKAQEQQGRKLRAEEREKSRQKKTAQEGGGKEGAGKGKGKGTKRKITSRAFIDSDEEGEEGGEGGTKKPEGPPSKKAKTTADAGGTATGQMGDEQGGAAGGGTATGDKGDEQGGAAAGGTATGQTGDEQGGAAGGGTATGDKGDEQGGAAGGGTATGQMGDEQGGVAGGSTATCEKGDEQGGVAGGSTATGEKGDEQGGGGKGKQKQKTPVSAAKARPPRRLSGDSGKPDKGKKKVDKVIVQSESAVQTLEDMLAARASAAGPTIKFQMIASEAHMGMAMLYVGAGPLLGKEGASFEEADSFAQSAIYQWVKNGDEKYFKSVIPFSLRHFNHRPIEQSVFDDLYNKGKELLTQSPEHAIIIALPGRIVNKEKSFPSPTSANPNKLKQLVLNLEELMKLKEENPDIVIYLVNGAHRVEVTRALMKASRESWGNLLVTAANVKDSEEKKKTLEQIRKVTELLEQAGSWCARVYDLDKMNASGHGEESSLSYPQSTLKYVIVPSKYLIIPSKYLTQYLVVPRLYLKFPSNYIQHRIDTLFVT
ncbi:hypothetical protein CC1G_13179 [Coprinopsis cinerea okayama7|uniref:Uncharacterized protein n=1 Tax=Coprinopsis cinerea (strain Okayama-7 / 130 / ATCC MYA-4618 / FGSC 9003) TaxID=240176 RepID=A8NL05_COPC7|nr:hypothetical protein CC1G_13179 [Coprinopsis cinerea okayama7\|eukprot:XP_001834585.2 hypothetical protein CC1G_13179 [Coprinopsis cinerea okayama7\